MDSLRFLWLIVFAILIGVATFLGEELAFGPSKTFRIGSLEYEIAKDLESLKNQKTLPLEFQKIHQVFILDERTLKVPIPWEELSRKYFHQNKIGNLDLQIEVFDVDGPSEDPSTFSEIVQYSFFEQPSKNKIYELNRSYSLKRKK